MIAKQFVAVRAVIMREGKVLIIRESTKYVEGTNSGKWDFPGGRIDVGESIFDGLKRETKEEVGIDVIAKKPFFVREWYPVIREEKVQIIGIYFLCETNEEQVTLSSDHDAFEWISLPEYKNFNLIPENKDIFESLLEQKFI